VRLVVDAAHGAAYRVAPAVFTELGADVIALGVKPNGVNINAQRRRAAPRAHGEARCVKHSARRSASRSTATPTASSWSTSAGRSSTATRSWRCARADAAPGQAARRNTLVATVMSNLGLERAMPPKGGSVVRTAVGDRYVVEAMRKGGFNLGGEQSGHLVFLDHATTGDGIVAALQVLAIMMEEGRPCPSSRQGRSSACRRCLQNASFKRAQAAREQMPRCAASRAQGREGARRARSGARALERHRGQAARDGRGRR
jgi:phosphoglucosamine mutase